MTQILNSVHQEVKHQMQKVQEGDLVTLWLSLPMLPVLLLWETLHRLLNPIVQTHIVKTRLVERTSIKISTWIVLLKVKLKTILTSIMTKFGRQ